MRRLLITIGLILVLGGGVAGQERRPVPGKNRNELSKTERSGLISRARISLEATALDGPLKKGNAFWQMGNAAAAIEQFKEAAKQRPTLYPAQHNLALAYLSGGEFRLAIAPLRQALALRPNSNELWQYLGLAYYNLKDFQKSADCFEKAVNLSPASPVHHNNAGYAYLSLQRIAEAEKSFKAALTLNPNMSQSVMGLCLTYGSARKSDATVKSCSRAQELDPEATAPDYFLGIANSDLGRYEEALEFLRQGLKRDPHDALMLVACGFAQYKMTRFSEALTSYLEAAKVKPSEQAYNGMGVVYFSMGKLKKALGAFNQALLLKPTSIQAHYNLGVACLSEGDRDCSLKQYNYLKIQDSPLASTLFAKMFADKILDVRARDQ